MSVSAFTTYPEDGDGRSITWFGPSIGPSFEPHVGGLIVLATASASRCVLRFGGKDVPPSVRDAAQDVHRILSQKPDADVRHYVTHEFDLDGKLVPKRIPGGS